MARPRKDSAAVNAKVRIREAFWKLYEQMPFERITVKDVCDRARCNKTTFYYHYDNLRVVLDEIEAESLPIEAPNIFVSLLSQADKKQIPIEYFSKNSERFRRYCFLLGPDGDRTFTQQAKDVMLEKWCEQFSIDKAALTLRQRMTIDFAMDGSIGVLAKYGQGGKIDVDALIDVLENMGSAAFMHVVDRCSPAQKGESL